jgi:hypothetical protein
MGRDEDHLGTPLLLEEVRKRLKLVLQNLKELEPQEQQRLRDLQELLEPLEQAGFELHYPRSHFPELYHELGHVLSQMELWGTAKVLNRETEPKAKLASEVKSKSEKWGVTLGWFIPRKYRHVIGDILEDCAEMREAGCTERRIKFHVVYQWLIAVITLVPMAVKTSIVDAVRQVISRPK